MNFLNFMLTNLFGMLNKNETAREREREMECKRKMEQMRGEIDAANCELFIFIFSVLFQLTFTTMYV
jgi:hypothetical protein